MSQTYVYSVYETGKSLASGAGELVLNDDKTYKLTFNSLAGSFEFDGNYEPLKKTVGGVQISIIGLDTPNPVENQSLTDITLAQSTIGKASALTGCFSITLNDQDITGLFAGIGA